MLSRVEDPNDDPRHKVDVLSGAQAQVVTGKKTRFARFGGGRARRRQSSHGCGGEARHRAGPAASDEPFAYQTAKLAKGASEISMEQKAKAVDAYYAPAPGFGDCWSDQITLVKRAVRKPKRPA